MPNDKAGYSDPKRFRIAFSFAGEKREFVAKVARILAVRFGEDKILYDKFHEAEFANADLAFDLPALYKSDSDLIVALFCPDYDRKEWCGLEWRAIFSIIKEDGSEQILLSRFDHVDGKGLFGLAGFIELDNKTPEEFATLILERLAINEGLPRSHYTKPVAASGDTPRTSIPHNLPSLQPFFGSEADNAPKPVSTPHALDHHIISGNAQPLSPQESPKATSPHDLGVSPPRIFISYSWDSPEHKQRVLQLAQRLRMEGLEARMDRFVPFPKEGWPNWMRSELKAAQFVLIVATETYRERFDKSAPTGVGLGVTWEGAIITQALFDSGLQNERFVPIVFDSTDATFIPEPLRAFNRFCIETEEGYDSLYRLLTNQPEIVAAPIGSIRLRESTFGVQI